MRTRWIILLFSGLIALTCWFLWQPASATFIDWYLCKQCRQNWGADWRHRGMAKEEGRWVVRGPCLYRGKELAGATFDIEAEYLEMSCNFKPLSWELDINIKVIEPRIAIHESDIDWDSLNLEGGTFGPLVRLNPHIVIEKGQLTFAREGQKTNPLYLDVHLDLIKGKKGELVAYLDPQNPERNRLKVQLSRRSGRRYHLQADIDELELYTLLTAYKTITPHWLDWEIDAGMVGGSLEAEFAKGKKPQYRGSVACKNLIFSHNRTQLAGWFPHITLDCRDNGKCWSCSIPEQGEVTLAREGQPYWQFLGIEGGVDWAPNSRTDMVLSSRCLHDGREQQFIIEGGGFFEEEYQEAVTLGFRLVEDEKEELKTRLFYRHLGERHQCVELDLQQLQPETFALVSHLVGIYRPDWKAFVMDKGSLDCALIAYIDGGYLTDVRLENLEARFLRYRILPWDSAFCADHLSGQLAFRANARNLLQTLDADLGVKNGAIHFLGAGQWHLDNIATHVKLREGVVQPSTFSASLGGLEGTVSLDGTAMEKLMQGSFEGSMQGVAALGSHAFEKGITQQFADDHLALSFNLSRYDEGLQLEGSAIVDTKETINFGCCLRKEKNEAWATYRYGQQCEEEGGYRIALWDQELRIAGFRIADGWFDGANLPLEKYVVPFFIRYPGLKMTGHGDFQGGFSQNSISINYDLRDVDIITDHFEITIPELDAKRWALHSYNLDTKENRGMIPIARASYYEKNSGLFFTDIKALVYVDEKQIKSQGVEAFCNGLLFEGDVAFDNLGAIDIAIHTMDGRSSQMQQILAHFDGAAALSKLPLEGTITQSGRGGTLRYNPQQGEWDIDLAWGLTEGVVEVKSSNLKLEELQLNVSFNLGQKRLDISDFQGSLFVGKADQIEEYIVAGDHFTFSDFTQNEADFDFWIGDKKRDIIRVVGNTAGGEEGITVALDHDLTHFGDVHPKAFTLLCRDWQTVDLFHIEVDFELKTLLYDLQKLGRTGLVPLSSHLINRFEKWKSGKGEFQLALDFNRRDGLFSYDLFGNEITIDNYTVQVAKLNGKSQNQLWSIDELRIDDWSLTAGITPQDESVKVHYLGARCGEALLLGIEGVYDLKKRFFDGRVNVAELDFNSCHTIPYFGKKLAPLDLKGCVKGSGKITVEADRKVPYVDVLLETQAKKMAVGDYHFSDLSDVSCHITSNRGITFRRVATHLLDDQRCDTGAAFGIERFDYNFVHDDLSIEGLHFLIPATYLPQTADALRPWVESEEFLKHLSHIKSDGALEGVIDCEITPPHFAIKAKLEGGDYRILNRTHRMEKIAIDYDPCEMHLRTQYHWNGKLLWVDVTSRSPALDSGEMTVALHHPDLNKINAPLTAHWRRDNHYYLERLFGFLPGLEVDLVQDETKKPDGIGLYLDGEVKCNGRELGPLVSEEVLAGIQSWDLGAGYTFKGKWTVQMPSREDAESLYYFHGDLLGNHFDCKGYQFDHLTAKVDVTPTYITLRSFEAMDACGVVYADRIEICLDSDDKWQVSLPQLKVNGFQPSMMRELGSAYSPVRKPLHISSIILDDLHGSLGDSTSLVGGGVLHFSNTTRKNHPNNFLAIPVEIIRRIGLDSKVMTPVRGTIEYSIRDGKVFFTRFKEMYSEGKLSRFFLADNDYKSFVDFDGNVNVQIRMKQNNLLFKLTELFTVSVKGTLFDPIYTMYKQSKDKN